MIPSFLITFRETLEAALIVGIILGYLIKTKQEKYNKIVYVGIAAGVVASIIGAFLFVEIAGGFSGVSEQIFEGVTMLLGAALLTTMILWMMKQKHLASKLQGEIAEDIYMSNKFGLFSLVFLSVLREGIETVIFLGAANFVSADNNLIGALAGIIAAVLLGYAIFVGSMKVDVKKFFNISSFLLILFSAGLVAHGVGEFNEAGIIPPVMQVWDINPPVNADGSYPMLHEKGLVGSLARSLFGYNGNPSLTEVAAYILYIAAVFVVWKRIEKQAKTN